MCQTMEKQTVFNKLKYWILLPRSKLRAKVWLGEDPGILGIRKTTKTIEKIEFFRDCKMYWKFPI